LSAPKSETEENQKAVVLYIDDLPVAQIFLEAEVLFESGALFKLLQKKSIQVGILSGDSEAQVKAVGQKLNITNLLWSQKPQDKARQIESSPNCLFVGDGVNDTLAFKKALVAVAVSGSLTEALKSADVYLVKPGLKSLEELFIISDLALLLIKRNLMFSAVYNFLAGGAAVLGLVNPLVAAVLMPISSVSMLLLTHFGAKK
jgi:P-type E1-E2 ATPase